MKIQTRVFGEIEINTDKLVHFSNGIIGFPEIKDYVLLFEETKEEKSSSTIAWLQSTEEPSLALPVLDPLSVVEAYEPIVEDELLVPLGEMDGDEMLVLSVVTVPSNLENMTINLKAPIIINSETRKGCQIIAGNTDLEVKYPVYHILKKMQEKDGE